MLEGLTGVTLNVVSAQEMEEINKKNAGQPPAAANPSEGS